GAAGLDGVAADGAPEAYAAYAAEAAAHRPKVDPAELDARSRFYAAERTWADEEKRAEAVVLYRDLLRSDAAVAREEADRIKARTELPKERFLPAVELRAGGDFRFAVVEKAEAAWVRGGEAGEHFVEIAFPALPDLTFKLWAYVGGCCAENFTFSCKVDELVQPVKHSILFLKRTHDLHGGPRQPKRWEWVALPLPKFATPGLKRVRLISDRQGFAVAAAQLSATRTAPPGDVETRDQLRKIALPSKPVDEALLGWWKLDAGSGAVAVDASGRGGHGTIHGARWKTSDGRAGLRFDGVNDSFVVPQGALDPVAEPFTIAFWARPEGERDVTPEETSGVTGVKGQRYAIFPNHGGDEGRAGLGVSVGTNGVSVFEHAGAHLPSLLVHDAAIGGWVHVTVVVANKKPVLYLDGVRAREGLTSGRRLFPCSQASLSEYGRYAGFLADVRIYKRALSDPEIRQVCGRPAPEPRR
ncbi:MAG TPA: LamG domain-containing protein, partial [Planctomycetota bacterium]